MNAKVTLLVVSLLAGCAAPNGVTGGPSDRVVGSSAGLDTGRSFETHSFVEYRYPNPNSDGHQIVDGPDGRLWFPDTGTNSIGAITADGVITEYPMPEPGTPEAITSGPDGALWVTQDDPIGDKGWIAKVKTDGTITVHKIPFTGSGHLNRGGIAAGADSNLWFTSVMGCSSGECVGRMTPSGRFTFFATTENPVDVTAGPDGNVWFTENNIGGSQPIVARVTPGGAITEFPGITRGGFQIVEAGDGNIYYGSELDGDGSHIVRVVPGTGAMTIVAHFQGTIDGLTGGRLDLRISGQTRRISVIRRLVLSDDHLDEIVLANGVFPRELTRDAARNIWFQDGTPLGTQAIGEIIFH